MKGTALLSSLFLALGAGVAMVGAEVANAQQAPDPRIADLVRAGQVRVALFLPVYIDDPITGEQDGSGSGVVAIELARALAARLDISIRYVGFPTPAGVVQCLQAGACDLAIMGINPARAAEVGLSVPFMQMDYTMLVPAGSSIRTVADADRTGIRIAVVRDHASSSVLSRILKHAELVYMDTADLTFDLLRRGLAHAMASARIALLDYALRLPGSWVLEDRYGAGFVAMAVRKDQAGRLAYISEFIEQAKTSGLLQRAVDGAGSRGIQVAPPANVSMQ
jgi:polar amino acid transport system substrate-binding protein